MPTFAIVIPNLNQSRFLPWALKSLRYQSQPFELALMDGGSTDKFHEAVKGYRLMITFFRSGPDGGQAAAIREGIKGVGGDIVSWLNADDYYFPGALDRVAAAFNDDPDLDVVYGDAVHVTSAGFFLSYFPAIQEFHPRDLTRSCFICQPACFVRRSAYEAVGGVDPGLHYTMDWDLWCRLSRNGARFRYLHRLLAAVRYYPGTKTVRSGWPRYREIWRIERKYGGRPLPFSWPGFYRFDLSLKKHLSPCDRLSFRGLERLRTIKRRLNRYRGVDRGIDTPIFGFRRWDTLVEGTCTVQIPWYGKRQWKRLHLDVDPGNGDYTILFQDGLLRTMKAREGRLSVDVSGLDGPLRKMSITCAAEDLWHLKRFSCELG